VELYLYSHIRLNDVLNHRDNLPLPLYNTRIKMLIVVWVLIDFEIFYVLFVTSAGRYFRIDQVKTLISSQAPLQ
jgi:hypothetical protein